jgi:CAAX protease family protein
VQFTGAATVTGLILLALMIGFVEESVFRGLMLTALREPGEWWAIVVTSVLFGVTHLANVLAGATLLETVSQVAYSVAIGVAFAALVLRKAPSGPWCSHTPPSMRPPSSRNRGSRSPRRGR